MNFEDKQKLIKKYNLDEKLPPNYDPLMVVKYSNLAKTLIRSRKYDEAKEAVELIKKYGGPYEIFEEKIKKSEEKEIDRRQQIQISVLRQYGYTDEEISLYLNEGKRKRKSKIKKVSEGRSQ